MDQPIWRERERIKCLECGKWFRTLPRHLRCKHRIEVDDYRLRHLIPVRVPLVCQAWSDRQRESNQARDAARTLSNRGAPKGLKRQPSVAHTRASHYKALSASGTAAAALIDKTANRRAKLAPYPVTVAQAAQRLKCSAKTAYGFLSYCVIAGKLARSARGVYVQNEAAEQDFGSPDAVESRYLNRYD